jgi:hypothetical protein
MRYLTIAVAMAWSGIASAAPTDAGKAPAPRAPHTEPAGAFKWDGRLPVKHPTPQLHKDHTRDDGQR